MKKKSSTIKQRRRFIAFLILVLLISIFSFFLFAKKDYTLNYKVRHFDIEERYVKKDDAYSFVIKNEETTFFAMILDQHFNANKIINDIDEYKTEDSYCIIPQSKKVRFIPLCYKNNEQISYHLVEETMKEQLKIENNKLNASAIKTIHNITLYYDSKLDYYLWNYRGFDRVSKDYEENISLFQKDIYTPNLITKVNDVLFIPDYDADYYFNKVYLLNMKTGKVETWNLNENIYFDSSILGVIDADIYVFDKHEKIEWVLNISKKEIRKVSTTSTGIIYQNEFQDISLNKLLYQDIKFSGVYPFEYYIDNGIYYKSGEYKIRVGEDTPTTIVSYTNDRVYYLKKDKLYLFDMELGEVLVMQNFEWNFNYFNMIFINY